MKILEKEKKKKRKKTKMKKRKICVSRVLKMTSLFFLSCAKCAQAETVS